jgi:hypothetical protein
MLESANLSFYPSAGMAFFIPEESNARIAVVALGIYLHCMAYSPGEGKHVVVSAVRRAN